ncbi:MAG TPA: septal ring lytic transglycosylase RlpA family protein [Bradyrhizobium sp.]|nr:septal ring lytic transglycosylase RlpA family protein [Bradyrhizobium sp.]
MRTTLSVVLLLSSSVTAMAAERGLASFYPGIGKRSEMTCAHRSHPFGKRLKVSHGNLSIECRVNDRGPFIRGRIIDVSTSAARALGMINAGVVRVVVEPVESAPAKAPIEITSVPSGVL